MKASRFTINDNAVVTNSGQRVGFFRSNGYPWIGVAGGTPVGPAPSRDILADMIFNAATVKSFVNGITRLVRDGHVPLRTRIAELIEADTMLIKAWNGATSMLWVVAEGVTCLEALDCPWTADAVKAELEPFLGVAKHRPLCVFHLDIADLQIRPVCVETALALAEKASSYSVDDNQIFYGDELLATVTVGEDRGKESVVVHIVSGQLVTPSTQGVLAAIGIRWCAMQSGQAWDLPMRFTLMDGASCLYSWEAPVPQSLLRTGT